MRRLTVVVAVGMGLIFAAPAQAQTPVCTKTVNPGTSSSSAFSGVPSGGTVCLNAGGYSWGRATVPNGVTVAGAQDVGFATVNGELSTEGRSGVRITDLYLINTGSHAVLNLRGSNNTAQFVNIHGGQKNSLFQGVLMSGNANSITDSMIHDVGTYPSEFGTRNHGIYYAGGTNGLIDRIWTWRISGYGFHFYGGSSITGTVLDHSVVDNGLSGRSIVKNISGSLTIRNTVTTDSGPVRCQVSPVAVTNSRSDAGGCGFVNGDTAYVNEAAGDYRNDVSGQFWPGPRW